MAFFDDWGWLGEIGEDIWSGVETVGDWLTGTEGIDKPFTDDLLAPAVKVGSQLIGPRTESGSFYDGSNLTGMLSNFIGDDASPWLDLGKTLYGGYRAGEAQEDYLNRMQPLQDYYSSVIPQMQAYYDPATARKGIRQEFETRKGMLTPYWEETDAKRRAQAAQAGMLGSSTYGKQLGETDVARAKYLEQQVLPSAEQAYYAQPTRMMTQVGNVGQLMQGQPLMQPEYQSAQRSPLETYFDTLIAKSL